MNKLSF